jgi:hypothetical protein
MSTFTCDCGATKVRIDDEMPLTRSKRFKCRMCGSVHRLQRPTNFSVSARDDDADEGLFVPLPETYAIGPTEDARRPLSPFAASVLRELIGVSQPTDRELAVVKTAAKIVVSICYLLALAAVACGGFATMRNGRVTDEIITAACWLLAVVMLCGGRALQSLLKIAREADECRLPIDRELSLRFTAKKTKVRFTDSKAKKTRRRRMPVRMSWPPRELA